MENTEFIALYNEFKQEQSADFHFQLLAGMVDLDKIQGNRIILKAQNEFSRDNFRARYLNTLQKKVAQKTEDTLLEIILERTAPYRAAVSAERTESYKAAVPAAEYTAPANRNFQSQEFPFGGHSRSSDNVNPKNNFANYVEGDYNRWAIAVGKALCQERNESYNPFFVWGSVGMGKTHLLHAIGNASKERHQKVLYTSTESFFNHFVYAIKNNKQEYFKKKYRNVDVLLIDDIHDLQKKNKAQDELFHIFNHFQAEGKQLVFTCDRAPQELGEFAERLTSRLKSGTNVYISSPAYEVRLAIVQAKSRELSLALPSSVADFLAENISDSIRDLYGALKKIHTFSQLLGQNIDIEMAKRELQEYFSKNHKPLLVRNIQRDVAEYYNLDIGDILSKRRNANIVLARQVAMHLSRELTPLSTTELGRLFHRDHATVITSTKKVHKMQLADQKFAGELQLLKRQLQVKQ